MAGRLWRRSAAGNGVEPVSGARFGSCAVERISQDPARLEDQLRGWFRCEQNFDMSDSSGIHLRGLSRGDRGWRDPGQALGAHDDSRHQSA